MIHKKLSLSSSNSTFIFNTFSNEINNIQENIYLNKNNFNQNSNDINENKYSHRLIQSLTDITTNNFYSSLNHKNLYRNNRAIRIESAHITNDYSHLLTHSIINASQPIIDINMNRTIDLIKRNGAGDENLSSHFNDKQVQTSTMIDNNHYLTLEQVPIHNRRTIQFTSKQLILISISVFIFVILLCLITIFFIL